VRLYGFRLSRVGDDVRTEFGLMTRISATIPIRRVQSITIREPLLYRAFARARVRVDTAGGSAQPGAQQKRPQREPLAPIIGAADVPALIAHIMPEVDATRFDWQPPHPRAFRRAVKPALVLALLLSLGAAAVVQWRAVIVAPVIAAWLVYVTYRQVQHLAWAATDDVVAFRSGWLGRSLTIVPVARIQAVRHIETPFDRRTGMGRVRVDTAGANPTSHRVDIPYLPRDVAFGLHHRLAAGAAASAFRW
jgi:putative membrane protein